MIDLATRADVVAIVRIERVQPMTAAESARVDRLLHRPPLNVTFRMPGPSVQVSARTPALKGVLPAGAVLRNGATNCEVILQEGVEYVVFAQLPEPSSPQYLPMHGTFRLDRSHAAQVKLAEVTSLLNSPSPHSP